MAQAAAPDVVERLAEIEHERWSAQAKAALFDMTGARRQRWTRQAATSYADLSEAEKEQDRVQVRKFAAVLLDERDKQWEKALHEELFTHLWRQSTEDEFICGIRARLLTKPPQETREQKVAEVIGKWFGYKGAVEVAAEIIAALRESEGK